MLREYCQESIEIVEKTKTFDPETNEIKEKSVSRTVRCGKLIEVVKEIYNDTDPDSATSVIRVFKCGHCKIVPLTPKVKKLRHPVLWNRLLDYQKKSVEFLEKNNGRALLAHDVGLGKTVISLSYIRENPETYDKICLIVTQAGDIYRWQEEAMEWLGLTIGNSGLDMEAIMRLFPNVFYKRGQKISPIGNILIASWTRLSDDDFVSQVLERGISSIILDESHMYKNEDSKRTKNLQRLIGAADSAAGKRIPVIFLTATPITNRLSEYATTLNIIDPINFPSKQAVLRYCAYDWSTKKYLGLDPRRKTWFFDITTKYVMRETKESVKLPLPNKLEYPVSLDITEWQSNQQFASAYNIVLDQLEQEIASAQPNTGNILGFMSQLRRMTGMMKVLSLAKMATEILDKDPAAKVTIGIHHETVREWLVKLLASYGAVSMSGKDDAEQKDEIEKKFKLDPSCRVLVANIIAAGQGRNLQFCRNAIIGERQWNRKREEQFIGRFHRIIRNEDGSVKTDFTDDDTVRIYITTAVNTFDEFFDELVNFKGAVCDSADELAEETLSLEAMIYLARSVIKKRLQWVGA